MTVAVYKSFCLKGRFISHLVCLGYPGLEGVDPRRNGIKKKANNKEHSQQFFEKAFQIMENLEHSVVLLLFLFTLDHSSFSANLYPSLKVTKTQLWALPFCVRQSVFVTSWMRPMCVWQECLLWNEPNYSCSSLAESEPVICINILYMAETWAT